MDISTKIQQGILIVAVSGKIDAVSVLLLDTEVKKITAGQAAKILFDFSQVTYINSSGLRVVLAMAKGQKNSGGKFALCGVSDEVKKVFTLAGFIPILTMYPALNDAVAAMASEAGT
ncbi:MAG: STAS domain-containing protein [Methanoregula sp.]